MIMTFDEMKYYEMLNYVLEFILSNSDEGNRVDASKFFVCPNLEFITLLTWNNVVATKSGDQKPRRALLDISYDNISKTVSNFPW